jgi:very-short-patch-repair endonuclease
MRRESTDAENRLWAILRSRNLDNLKFRRQVPIGAFIVDFCCLRERLIVELDGGQHLDQLKRYDDKRSKHLESVGFKVLRFWNSEVLDAAEGVVAEISRVLAEMKASKAK